MAPIPDVFLSSLPLRRKRTWIERPGRGRLLPFPAPGLAPLEQNMDLFRDGKPPKRRSRRDSLSGRAKELQRARHAAVKKVTADIEERFNFNTAISAIMELVNAAYGFLNEISAEERERHRALIGEALETIIVLLAPFAPHICEELWHRCGFAGSVHKQQWPSYNQEMLQVEEVEVVIQVNGKVRGRILVPAGLSEEELLEEARQNEKVRPYLEGKELVKAITIPGKLVNIVVR